MTFTAGSPDGAARSAPSGWRIGASIWTRGDMLGLTAPQGTLHPARASRAKPGQMQGIEVLVKRPAGLGANADGVRVVLEKVSSVTTAVDCDVHLLGLRKASEAEVLAAPGAGRARGGGRDAQQTTITGI